VDDIAAMVAEAIARRVKAAQAQGQSQLAAQAQAGNPRAQALLARMNAGAAPAPAAAAAGPVAKPSVPMGMASPPARLTASAPADLPVDTLPGLPLTIFDEAAAPRPELLNSFNGTGLLAAIVLSEALARPVALREGGSGTLF
jgi:hypothetical protein